MVIEIYSFYNSSFKYRENFCYEYRYELKIIIINKKGSSIKTQAFYYCFDKLIISNQLPILIKHFL